MKYLAILSFFAVAGCAEVTSPVPQLLSPKGPNSQVLINDRSSFSGLIPVVACNGEPLTLAGTVHLLMGSTSSNNAGVHEFFSVDYSFSGIGQITGAKYEGRLSGRQQYEQGGAQVYTISRTIHLISQGNIPNSLLDVDVKFVTNANGEPTVENFAGSARCQ